ncbi:peptide/opine/nickel uptake family ABC transporter, periplasmic substrate-binding protein [Oceanicola granulosus HTCC2516]|uniref:Peptide/opine/nickel uptake family ABC transporter, periplasmic substrate-binding protein n=1 Tax=Oceanicola granulosus (strain ATCC BAA-861 / DSM 15982 / KCTC 12143 / HTCC2516) TaxID=314256 RepID=Q2CJQ5_OCEGH|nr:ABC transporter substrate-binding protein [Oceanicola granulosus]EAR53084.1 peptide/opine/nickel uptake family ABC transporter, periplasmic substrate-binding protein [Oceanicola granulosus HTCC2516]
MSGAANRARRQLLATGLAAAVFAASGVPVRAAARRGGTLRAGLGGGSASDSWDGAGHEGLFMQAVGAGAVFDTLTEVAADGTLRGELAVGWEPLEQARVWDVTLREGVRFHDGAPFTGADVVATFARLGATGPLAQVSDIALEGPSRVRLVLETANPNFPYELSDPRLIVQPGGVVGPVGTGLYRAVAFEPGRRFVGRRVDGHWRDGQAGWFDRVDVLAFDPAAVRLAALRSGRVDAIDGVELHAVGMLRAAGDHALQEAGSWLQAVSHRVGVPPRVGTSRPMDDARFLERWWAA